VESQRDRHLRSRRKQVCHTPVVSLR
jgi:hypothetical protein